MSELFESILKLDEAVCLDGGYNKLVISHVRQWAERGDDQEDILLRLMNNPFNYDRWTASKVMSLAYSLREAKNMFKKAPVNHKPTSEGVGEVTHKVVETIAKKMIKGKATQKDLDELKSISEHKDLSFYQKKTIEKLIAESSESAPDPMYIQHIMLQW